MRSLFWRERDRSLSHRRLGTAVAGNKSQLIQSRICSINDVRPASWDSCSARLSKSCVPAQMTGSLPEISEMNRFLPPDELKLTHHRQRLRPGVGG
jgi:hypothetical protein